MRYEARRTTRRHHDPIKKSFTTEDTESRPSWPSRPAMSVQHSINEPTVRRPIAKDPIDGTIGERHVPFVAAPGSAASAVPGSWPLRRGLSRLAHVGLSLTLSARALLIRWPLTTIDTLPIGCLLTGFVFPPRA